MLVFVLAAPIIVAQVVSVAGKQARLVAFGEHLGRLAPVVVVTRIAVVVVVAVILKQRLSGSLSALSPEIIARAWTVSLVLVFAVAEQIFVSCWRHPA